MCFILPSPKKLRKQSASMGARPGSGSLISLTPLRAAGGGFRYALLLAVGTPEQRLTLVFDTGSHLLLLRDVASGACTPSEPYVGGPCFNSTRSTSLWSSPSERSVPLSFSYIVDVNMQLHGTYVAASDLCRLGESFNSTELQRTRVDAALLPAASRGGLVPPESLPFFMADAAGVVGASPTALAAQAGAWQQLIAGYDRTFALDLNRDEVRASRGPSQTGGQGSSGL